MHHRDHYTGAAARPYFAVSPFLDPALALPRPLRLLAAASAQTVAVQVLGVAFFYALSFYIPKGAFGLLGWCTATAFLIATVASLGLEQVVLRRVSAAATGAADWAIAAFFFHGATGAVVIVGVLGALHLVFPGSEKLALLPWFFGAQALTFAALPFRLLLNARRRFAPYAVVGLLSNGLKLASAIVLGNSGLLNLHNAVFILLAGGVIELAGAGLVAWRATGLRLRFRWRAYRLLVLEARPQFLSVLFDTGLARLDWILLGLLATNAAVAEYSFAYRAFEMERLPTAALGAVMMPLAARWLARGNAPSESILRALRGMVLLVIGMAGWVAVIASAAWIPSVDAVTKGAYGLSSGIAFALLNAALPMQYAINIFWTQTFAARQYRSVATITAIAAAVNLTCNLVLIPVWHSNGAAAAFLIASAVQLSLYCRLAIRAGFLVPVRQLTVLLLLIVGIIILIVAAGWQDWRGILLGLVAYPGLVFITRTLRPEEIRPLLQNLKR